MESIQLTGNKPTFNNYLTDPMILPINAKVCLNKASFAIPVWTQQYVEMPLIDTADQTNLMFIVQLNGVSVQITWQDFYTAWDALNMMETRTADEFYNGTYKFYFNNLVYWISTINTLNTLPTFTEVLAKALDTAFLFYSISPSDIILNGVRTEINKNDTIILDTVELLPYTSNLQIKALQLISEYSPEKIQALTATEMTDAAAPNDLWTLRNCQIINTNDIDFNHTGSPGTITGVAISKGTDSWSIDPNGGYWGFRPHLGNDPSTVICGFMFMNGETKINTTVPTVIDPKDIRHGIEFKDDGSIETYRAIDGLSYDGNPQYYPESNIFEYENDIDEFYISVRRAADYENNEGKFIVQYLQGDVNNPGIDNANVFYQCYTDIPGAGTLLVPVITCDQTGGSGAGGIKVKDNVIIDTTSQSLDMDLMANVSSGKSFSIRPIPDSADVESLFYQHQFFDSIGLYQNEDDSNQKSSLVASSLNNKLKWTMGKLKKKYFIGIKSINKVFDASAGFLDLKAGSSALPRQIEVSLLNTSHTPHTGSFAQEVLFTEPDINKVISYINTDADDFNTDNNLYLEYVYEAYNIVCRRLKNRSKLPLNNFQIKIGYKDFITNEEKVLDALQGICKLEILFEGEDDQH